MTANSKNLTTKDETQPTSKPSSNVQIDASKLTDFEISLLVLERDVSQYRVERINELLNGVGEAKGFSDAENKTAFVSEETFNLLKYEPAKGQRLGEFMIAHKNSNLPDKWNHAYTILRQNNAVISSRYSGPDYQFSYWLYDEDRIFRQKRKQ